MIGFGDVDDAMDVSVGINEGGVDAITVPSVHEVGLQVGDDASGVGTITAYNVDVLRKGGSVLCRWG